METAVRHLTRSRRNRVFAGLCGGMADYLGWDAVLIRAAYVALTLLSFGAAGVLLYLFAWIVVPLEGEQPEEPPAERSSRTQARLAIGILLLLVGALALFDSFTPWFWRVFSLHTIALVLLIALGLVVILWKTERPASSTANAPGTVPLERTRQGVPSGRLVRLQRGRKIAGVCSGLGGYFGMDPTIVRLLFVALFLAGGSGALLYIILWVVMPLEIS